MFERVTGRAGAVHRCRPAAVRWGAVPRCDVPARPVGRPDPTATLAVFAREA